MSVWLCGIAPAEESERIDEDRQVPWCATRSGGKRLRALIGPEVCNAHLCNASDKWLGRKGGSDVEPPVEAGENLLRRIVRTSAGTPTCIALFGLRYWRKVIRHCTENAQDLKFLNRPGERDLLCGFNVLRVQHARSAASFFQIELLPHPRHWEEPSTGEGVASYRQRSAQKIGQNGQLDATSDDFLSAVRDLMEAFDEPPVLCEKGWTEAFRYPARDLEPPGFTPDGLRGARSSTKA